MVDIMENKINRRSLFGALAGIPFLGWLKPLCKGVNPSFMGMSTFLAPAMRFDVGGEVHMGNMLVSKVCQTSPVSTTMTFTPHEGLESIEFIPDDDNFPASPTSPVFTVDTTLLIIKDVS